MTATFPDLKGQSVFITGGGSGIGAALTDGFMGQGAKVAFVQRSDASIFAAEMLDKHGVEPFHLACDIANVPTLQAAMEMAADQHGAITVLVNNAANDTRHDLPGTSVEDWDQGMAVNLRPHFFTAQTAAPGMKAAGGGAIINFSSISYMMGNAGYPGYAASKAALRSASEALAMEGAAHGVRVVMVEPGMVDTEFPQATRRSGPATSGEGPYAPLAGELIASFRRWREQHPTPPEAVADAIVAAVAAQDPPFHLPVGEDAVRMSDLRRQVSDAQYLALVAEFLGLDSLRS